MIRHFPNQTAARAHTLSDRQVHCPNARNGYAGSAYWTHARPGNWISYTERATDGTARPRLARVLGRVEAPAIEAGETPIDGWLSVLALSDEGTFGYIRWINPADVECVETAPPAAFLAFFAGPLPTPDLIYRLVGYGAMSDRYIADAPELIKKWQSEKRAAAQAKPAPQETV